MSDIGKEIDWLVITAANRAQARGYRAQLRARRGSNLMRRVGRTLVVPDVGDRRIGSGAATLIALARIAAHLLREGRRTANFADLFRGQRILIVHCGGDSRRLPAYAAQGKVFLPLPYAVDSGGHASLFDLMLADLLALEMPADGRAIVASGDVFLDLSSHSPQFDRPGIVGVAWLTDADRGARHGVYALDEQGNVSNFLQKPDRTIAAEAGALSADDQVHVDTGILAFDPPAIASWLTQAGAAIEDRRVRYRSGLIADLIAGGDRSLDLYSDMLRVGGDSWLTGIDFSALTVPDCAFLHLGTTRELIDCLVREPATIARHAFEPQVRNVGVAGSGLEEATIYNSIVEAPGCVVGPDVLLEACHVGAPLRLAGGNIVVGLPGEATLSLDLPADIGLVCLPVGDTEWSAVCFGLTDDCKTSRQDGGTFCGRPLDEFVQRAGDSTAVIWKETDPGEQTFFDARLWSVGPIDEVLAEALALTGDEPLCSDPVSSKRFSIAALLARVDHRRLLAHRRAICDEVARATTP